MERNRLIVLAPQYYATAICMIFESMAVASSDTIWHSADFENGPTFWQAIQTLLEQGMLSSEEDEFGPTIFRRASTFNEQWNALKKSQGTPYSRYALGGRQWIVSALENLNKALKEQKVVTVDFSKPDAEWEPLPVDRKNPNLQNATKELDKTIIAVEGDNGYSATLPEERTFVVENLREANERLKKESTISYAYLKRKVIDVLDILIRQFGKAAVGLAAQAARQAVFDWLKELGEKALHWIA